MFRVQHKMKYKNRLTHKMDVTSKPKPTHFTTNIKGPTTKCTMTQFISSTKNRKRANVTIASIFVFMYSLFALTIRGFAFNQILFGQRSVHFNLTLELINHLFPLILTSILLFIRCVFFTLSHPRNVPTNISTSIMVSVAVFFVKV